jgi:hypothetical protein
MPWHGPNELVEHSVAECLRSLIACCSRLRRLGLSLQLVQLYGAVSTKAGERMRGGRD